jgi:hypothetical protein
MIRIPANSFPILKGTGKCHENGLKVVWLERSRLVDGPPAIHYFLNSPFHIICIEFIGS